MWIFALLILPPVVLVCWWLIGRTHLKVRGKRRRYSESDFEKRLLGCVEKTSPSLKAADSLLNIVNLPIDLPHRVFPPTSGNSVRLLYGAMQTYEAWKESIGRACRHIHMLFYEWMDDSTGIFFRDALIEAVKRGVEVRVLIDAIGTKASRRFFNPLIEAGGKFRLFLPLRLHSRPATVNFRNHRKLIVVDGKEAFIGGMNVGDKYLQWLDLCIQIEGPGVDQVQEVFCEDWFFTTDEDLQLKDYFGNWKEMKLSASPFHYECSCAVVSGGPHQTPNAISETTLNAFNAAKQRIWIMTPYFIPDSELLLVLRMARYRGVDVRVILPAKNNHPLVRRASRAYYPLLLKSGVRIFEYEGMMHAKASIIDDHILCIGSANLDQRSFLLNFELSCFIESTGLNSDCSNIYLNTLEKCVEIIPENFEKLPWATKVVDSALHLFSPVL